MAYGRKLRVRGKQQSLPRTMGGPRDARFKLRRDSPPPALPRGQKRPRAPRRLSRDPPAPHARPEHCDGAHARARRARTQKGGGGPAGVELRDSDCCATHGGITQVSSSFSLSSFPSKTPKFFTLFFFFLFFPNRPHPDLLAQIVGKKAAKEQRAKYHSEKEKKAILPKEEKEKKTKEQTQEKEKENDGKAQEKTEEVEEEKAQDTVSEKTKEPKTQRETENENETKTKEQEETAQEDSTRPQQKERPRKMKKVVRRGRR